jgi:purine catabolism regulator
MGLTVGEFCRHPVVLRGDPVVLAGQPALDRPVRWVHSSDIYEMGPLLRDGDLLLTTGLGLRPHDADGRREFVRQVAQSGAAGVVLELCRFFTAAPEEMVAEADELGLPLVGLRAVVPFVEVTQAVNELLVDGAVRRLREADEISRGLSSALAAGRDLPALLAELGRRLGRPVTLTTADGTVLGGTTRGPAPVPGAPALTVPVLVHGSAEAWLSTGLSTPDGEDDELVGDVLDRAADTLALALLRSSADRGADRVARRRLVAALLDGDGAPEVAALARTAGLPDTGARCVVAVGTGDPGGRVVGALDVGARRAAAALRAGGEHGPGTAVTAEVGGRVCVVLASAAPARRTAAELREQLTRALHEQGVPAAVVVGPEVGGTDELARSAAEALRLLAWADALPGAGPVHAAAELGAERALLAAYGRAELTAYAREQLGPLLDADARSGGQLLATLEAVLDAPDGKAGAARRLRIQRQTLYQRLERIETALGADLTDARVRDSLLLALRAHALVRPVTGAAVSRPGPRRRAPATAG